MAELEILEITKTVGLLGSLCSHKQVASISPLDWASFVSHFKWFNLVHTLLSFPLLSRITSISALSPGSSLLPTAQILITPNVHLARK